MQSLSPEALQNIRLIATDMDGTLTQQEKFTPLLLQTLHDLAKAEIPVLIVTGRSAGWVNSIIHYFPIAGAIAENGGLFYANSETQQLLVPIDDIKLHRQKLSQMFDRLQTQFPQIRESTDNQFRITDWTFDVQGLSPETLKDMSDRCHAQGWGFTYSTVQCHIKPIEQEKAIGLKTVLNQFFPTITPNQVVTIGDSPNDQSLFDRSQFPTSIGVANIQHYANQMRHLPTHITIGKEVEGFCEIARSILPQA